MAPTEPTQNPSHSTPCPCADIISLKERVRLLDREINGNGQPGRLDRMERDLSAQLNEMQREVTVQFDKLEGAIVSQSTTFLGELSKMDKRIWKLTIEVILLATAGGGTAGYILKMLIGG